MPAKQLEQSFYKMTNEDYHRGQGAFAISKSGLSTIMNSARRYKYEQDHPEALDIFDLKAKKFNNGTAVHTWFLEREKFDKEISVIPVFGGTGSKARREKYQEKIRTSNQTPIEDTAFTMLKGMDESLHSGYYETARKILEAPDKFIEMSGFWQDDETGLWCKTRPDLISNDMVVWDIKTYSRASWQAWNKNVFNLNYDLQAYMALKGTSVITGKEHTEFGHIVFETDPPWDIGVYLCDEDTLKIGESKFIKAMAIYQQCLEKDYWPGIEDSVQLLSPPQYEKNKIIYM